MLSTTLVRAAGGFRQVSHSFRALTPITYRHLFYPSAPRPEGSTNESPGELSLHSTYHAEFSDEKHPHLSEGQFHVVRHYGGAQVISPELYHGLIPERQETMRLGGSTPEERWEQSSFRFADLQREPAGIHTGRTVVVDGHGVGDAYAKLQALLRVNNVRKELRLAERHEKRGAKRRRLRSERWRRKFADEVRKKVKLVTEIRMRDRMWGARH